MSDVAGGEARPRARSIVLELARARDGGDPFEFTLVPQEYLVREVGGTYRTIAVPWDRELLGSLAAASRSRSVAQEVGDRLRSWLQPAGWDPLAEAARSATPEAPLIVTIRAAAAELFALPWELATLGAGGRHLAEAPGVVLRYEWPGAERIEAAIQDEPPRVLFAWSAAGGEVPAAAQQQSIASACAAAGVDFDPGRDVVAHLTRRRLADALARGPTPSVLHLLCHGHASGSTRGLVWGDDEGAASIVDGAALRSLIAPHVARLRLVILCACSSGDTEEFGDHLGSVAQALHRIGVAAVIASRQPLSIAAAGALTEAIHGGLLAHAEPLEVALLRARAAIADINARAEWASIQLYARVADGDDTRPVALRPYRGLLPFEAGQRRFFFGRDREIDALAARVRAAAEDRERGLLVVIGVSGSGKSSLVRGGVIPRLGGAGDRRWRVALLRPSEREGDAWAALIAALAGACEVPAPEVDDPAAIEAWFATITGDRLAADERLLIVVDQLEEALGLADPTAARRLGGALWRLSRAPRVAVVATLRLDALERCGAIELGDSGVRLDRLVYDEGARFLLGPPDASALRSIITDPAAAVGVGFEAGLVDRIIADADGQPGLLPLLEHLLDGLWRRREGRIMTFAGYDALGGLAGALARGADAAVEAMTADEQAIARAIVTALIEVDDEGAPRGRRLIDVDELRPDDPAERDTFDRAREGLVRARLVVIHRMSDGTCTLDLAHEALIRGWPRLRGWLDEDREALRAVARLREWHARWLALAEQPDAQVAFLTEEDRLLMIQGTAARYPALVNGPLQEFVDESLWQAAARRRRSIRQTNVVTASVACTATIWAISVDPGRWVACAAVLGSIGGAFLWELVLEERVDLDLLLDNITASVIMIAFTLLAVAGFHGETAGADRRLAWVFLALVVVRLMTLVALAYSLRDRRQLLHCLGPMAAAVILVLSVFVGEGSPIVWWVGAHFVDVAVLFVVTLVLRIHVPPILSEGNLVASLNRYHQLLLVGVSILVLIGAAAPGARVDASTVILMMLMIGVFAVAGHTVRAEAKIPLVGLRRMAWVMGAGVLTLGLTCFGVAGHRLIAGAPLVPALRWGFAGSLTAVAFAVILFSMGVDPKRRPRGFRVVVVAAAALLPLPAIAAGLTLGLDAERWSLTQCALVSVFTLLMPLMRGHAARLQVRRRAEAPERAPRGGGSPAPIARREDRR